MYLLFLAATSTSGGLAALSQVSLVAGITLVVVMALAYLAYTLGSVSLAKRLLGERVATNQTSKASQVAAEGGNVATLVRNDVILHEQPDGEEPIALNRGLVLLGRLGSLLGCLTVFALFLGLALRSVVEPHAPWSNLCEFAISVTTAILICYLVFEARFHERVRAWGLYVCVLAVIPLSAAVYLGGTHNLISDSLE